MEYKIIVFNGKEELSFKNKKDKTEPCEITQCSYNKNKNRSNHLLFSHSSQWDDQIVIKKYFRIFLDFLHEINRLLFIKNECIKSYMAECTYPVKLVTAMSL